MPIKRLKIVSKITNFRLPVESLMKLKILSFIYKKSMNRYLNTLIEEQFERDKDHPIVSAIRNHDIEKITKEFLEKSLEQ